jgi:predicted RNase H-like HicB family nuclease
MRRFTVILEKDEDGQWVGVVPVLAGLSSFGATREEALANTREAIECFLEARLQIGQPLPEVEEVTVEVALG